MIGPFKKGPAFVPTIVNTQSEFEEIFGVPDGTYYTDIYRTKLFKRRSTVTIVRVGHVGGYTHVDPVGIVVSGSLSGSHLVVEVVDNYLVHYLLPRMVLNQLVFHQPQTQLVVNYLLLHLT